MQIFLIPSYYLLAKILEMSYNGQIVASFGVFLLEFEFLKLND
jgi:hypothetical protein